MGIPFEDPSLQHFVFRMQRETEEAGLEELPPHHFSALKKQEGLHVLPFQPSQTSSFIYYSFKFSNT
jgi:hypothetical protein